MTLNHRVNDGEVRIVPDGELAFVGQAKACGDVGGEDTGDASRRNPECEQTAERELDAADAAPDLEEVRARFHVGRSGRMIRANGVDQAFT